jgi:hypothetical protein
MVAQLTGHRTVDTGDDLAADLRLLEMRLEDGYRKIERAVARGEDVSRWEDHWIRLLREYEQLYARTAA